MHREDITKLTPTEYHNLSVERKVAVHERAQVANRKILDEVFRGQVDWVIIAGASGKIIAQGTKALKICDEQIAAAEHALDAVCYFYSRPDVVEETGAVDRLSIGPFVDSAQFERPRGIHVAHRYLDHQS